MTNGDPKGRIFLSYPHKYNGLFVLLTTVLFIHFIKQLPEVPEYATSKMQFHMTTLLNVLSKIAKVR